MNIHKSFALFIIFIMASTVAAKQDIDAAITSIISALYSKPGLTISADNLYAIKKLLYILESSSRYQLQQAALIVVDRLTQELQSIKQTREDLTQQEKQVSRALFYKEFLLQQYRDHFIEFSKFVPIKTSFFDTLWHTTSNLYNKIIAFIRPQKSEDQIKALADQIMNFIQFEQDNILFNYKTLLHFLYLKKQVTLPQIIDVWNTPDLEEKLKKRAINIGPEVEVQFEGLLVSMALQGAILAGGSLATQWEDDKDKALFDQLTQDQNKIITDWQTFQKALNQDQKTIITNINTAFTTSQQGLNNEYKQSNAKLQEEILYLNQSINLDKPIDRALAAPITWDQYFEAASMLTPMQGYPWYNVFQVNKGDWQFDSKRKSFWQYGLAPFPIPQFWQGQSGSIFDTDPAANSIFAEYITGKLSYTIEIEMTLVNIGYPFFVGIMFNRGRWVSGDPERLWQYRLLGLYGTQPNANDTNTRSIDLCFAQQILKLPKTPQDQEKIISPLEQITSDQTTHLYKLDKKEVEYLATNPRTFIVTIVTNPDSIQAMLSKKDDQGSITQLVSTTRSNLDSYIYMFHGIGFMATGCQAEFVIKQPQELIYNDQQIKDFNAQLAQEMAKS